MIGRIPSPKTFLNRAFITVYAAFFIGLLLFTAATPRVVSGQRPQQPRRDVDDVLSKYDRLILNPEDVLKQVRQTGKLNLSTSEGEFDLQVEPFDIRSDHYRAVVVDADGIARELPRTPSHSFRGSVIGVAGTYVRLVIDDELFEGIIITPGETFFVEPRRNFNPSADLNESVFYSESNLKAQSLGECGTTMAQRVNARAASAKPDPSQANVTITTGDAFGPKAVAEVATEADFEFTSAHTSQQATVDDINQVMTMVNGIYDAQLGINLIVTFHREWAANNDPYTVTAPQAALQQFASSYDNSFAPSAPPTRDLTHMFTGKDLDGSTIGIAYIATVCESPESAYGISQSNFSTNSVFRVALTAHEMGHNFGASHTGPSSNPNDPPQQIPGCDVLGGAIMQPSVSSNATGFCQFSRDEITDHTVRFGSCLTRSAAPGCSYSLTPTTAQFPTAGGSGGFSVTAGTGCTWAVAEGLPWLDITSGTSGTGSGAVNFSVAANGGGPRSGTMDVAGQIFTVIQSASPNCGTTAIAPGQTINGALASTDCRSGQAGRPTAYADLYTFNGMAGEQVRIEMSDANATAPALDTYLYLFGPDDTLVAENDDIQLGVVTNSRIPATAGTYFTLPQTGRYTIEATSYGNNVTGSYTLTLTAAPLLLKEAGNGNAAAALDSVTFVRSSFPITNPFNFSADQRIRLILFTSDLGLQQQNPAPSDLSVQMAGNDLVVENVGPFSFAGLNGSYVVVALRRRDGGAMPTGNLVLTVTCRGIVSNTATITISP